MLLSQPLRPESPGMIEQEGDSKMHSTPMKILPREVTVISDTVPQKSAEALLIPKSLNPMFNPLTRHKMRKAQASILYEPSILPFIWNLCGNKWTSFPFCVFCNWLYEKFKGQINRPNIRCFLRGNSRQKLKCIRILLKQMERQISAKRRQNEDSLYSWSLYS